MAQVEKEDHFREIITKAVCGKGKKFTQASHTITPAEKPSSILGCWIINHTYSATKKGDAVEVNGSYDINVWFSHSDNTKTEVVTENKTYTDVVPLKVRDENMISADLKVIANPVQQPNTLEATISPNESSVVVQVEREFLVEVIGETKLKVAVSPEGVIEELEELEEDLDDEVTDEELEQINPNFIDENES